MFQDMVFQWESCRPNPIKMDSFFSEYIRTRTKVKVDMMKLKKWVKAVLCAGLFFVGGLSFAKDEGYYLEIDEYLGQALETVESFLGTPSEDGIDTIYEDYKSESALDPEYSMYFPSGELKNGVEVRIVVWEGPEICSIVWAKKDKENYGDWIVFTSVAHDDKVKF